jgi:hypothetical protein
MPTKVIHTIEHYIVGDVDTSGALMPRYAEVRALEVATITRDSEAMGNWAPPTTGIQVWLMGCMWLAAYLHPISNLNPVTQIEPLGPHPPGHACKPPVAGRMLLRWPRREPR